MKPSQIYLRVLQVFEASSGHNLGHFQIHRHLAREVDIKIVKSLILCLARCPLYTLLRMMANISVLMNNRLRPEI